MYKVYEVICYASCYALDAMAIDLQESITTDINLHSFHHIDNVD